MYNQIKYNIVSKIGLYKNKVLFFYVTKHRRIEKTRNLRGIMKMVGLHKAYVGHHLGG